MLFKVGISSKKVKVSKGGTVLKASDKETYTLAENSFDLIPPFDLIEALKEEFNLGLNFKIF